MSRKDFSNAPKHRALADGHLSPKDLREYTGLLASPQDRVQAGHRVLADISSVNTPKGRIGRSTLTLYSLNQALAYRCQCYYHTRACENRGAIRERAATERVRYLRFVVATRPRFW